MKESKAVYVTRHKIRGDQKIIYQLDANWDLESRRTDRYDNYYFNKTNDFACQFDSKKDVCTCRNVYRREPMYFSKIPKQVYAYHGSRSFTDVGVGSVKALQRRKVRRVYLPETDDRGVGSSDLSAYTIRRTKPLKGSYYDHKKTSSKCVGGIIEYNTGCVISEKLSPILNTKSGTTSPKMIEGHKNIEIGSNTVVKKVATVGTQFEIDGQEEIDTPKKEEPKLEAMSTKVYDSPQKYKKPSSTKKSDKIKDAERQFSSDSLVQHVHNLEVPSEDKPSRTSLDPMENQLEREYRRIFAAKDKDSKPSCDKPIPDFKSASVLRRRFDALRRGLTKKDDLKKGSFIPKSSQSRESTPSHKDASVTSDPPSLEGRSYSDTKRYSPIQANIIAHDRPRMNYRNERETLQYSTTDSDCQGVKGMFKLWGKKFNLEEEYYNKKQSTPIPSYNAPKKSEKEMEKKESEKKKPETELKKEKRFFFFKKKPKEKIKDPGQEPPKQTPKNVTAGRCEITDGLTIKMGKPSSPVPVQKEKTPKAPEEGEEITRKRWLRRFLSSTIESARSVNVRWNNTTYGTSSSTVFELLDTVYKNTEILMNSLSEVSSLESYYRSNMKTKVNFIQDIEAWMVPKTIPDRPKEIPVKMCSKREIQHKTIELSYFNQKCLVDESKAHKIEVVLHSKNVNVKRNSSSEYLKIDIPADFFDDLSTDESKRNQTSDEEVYKIVEYESDSDTKNVKKYNRMEKGDNPQSDIKVIVSVQDSKNLKSKILETVIKRPPMHRDVIIQGSNVHVPKRCDVIGVGIITQRDLREMRKPILKIQNVSSFDDSDPPPLLIQKKCEFAESYLQEYYKHWTPLGLDFYSCVSDSHLKSCSEKSLSFHNHQGDGCKSCPNICDDYKASAIISSCETSSGGCAAYSKQNEKKQSKFRSFVEKCSKCNKGKDVADVAAKRMLPKDSLEVFKRRKLYAQSDRAQWSQAEDKPVSVPSIESRGEQDHCIESRGEQDRQGTNVVQDCLDNWGKQDQLDNSGNQNCQDSGGEQDRQNTKDKVQDSKAGPCRNDDCPQIEKPVVIPQNKRKNGKKHVSMPDCETMQTDLKNQLGEKITGGILNFKGSAGCDANKKKHASISMQPSLEIPEPPCKINCVKQSSPPCSQPNAPPCKMQPPENLCPAGPGAVCVGGKTLQSPPDTPPTPKCAPPTPKCPPSTPKGPPPTMKCPPPPASQKPSRQPCPPPKSGPASPPCPPPKSGPASPPCPPPKICPASPPCPPPKSGPASPPCPLSPPPSLPPSPPLPRPSQPKKIKCPYATESPPPCPASLPTCDTSPPQSPKPNPTPTCPSPKTCKPTCPFATDSPPKREETYPPCAAMKPNCRGVVPPCPSVLPQKKPKNPPPPPCPASLPACQKPIRQPCPQPCPPAKKRLSSPQSPPCPSPKTCKPDCPYATDSSSSGQITPPCPAMKPDCKGVTPPCPSMAPQSPKKKKPKKPPLPPCPATLPACQKPIQSLSPEPCTTLTCPSQTKNSKTAYPYGTESPPESEDDYAQDAAMEPDSHCPSCPSIAPCPKKGHGEKKHKKPKLPPCPATLPPCQKPSRQPPPITEPTSPSPSPSTSSISPPTYSPPPTPRPSQPKKSKLTYPYATESPPTSDESCPQDAANEPDSHGVTPSCPSMIPCPQKMPKNPPPPPYPASLPASQKPSRQPCPPPKCRPTSPPCPPSPPTTSSSSSTSTPPTPPKPKKSKPIPYASNPCPAMKPGCCGVIPPCPSMLPQNPKKTPKTSPPPCPAFLPPCQRPSRTIPGLGFLNKNSTTKIPKKIGLCPRCTAIKERAAKSASKSSSRACTVPKEKKSKKNKKTECCSRPPVSACPSTNQASQCPSAKSSRDYKSSQSSCVICACGVSTSPAPCPGEVSPDSSSHSISPPPIPKPPKLCNRPPCNQIDPTQVDSKRSKPKNAGCCQEFPWPMNNQISNQPSPQTSEGCLSKLIDKIKDNKDECQGRCSMLRSNPSCCPSPTPMKDSDPQCPSKVKVPNPCGDNNKRITGIFLRKNPSKKKTCAKECSAWESEPLEPGIVRLNSRENITIKLKQQSPSTEEIRELKEGMKVKVQDEDGRTLYERRDYCCGKNRSSVCGNIYDAKLNRISTPVMVTNLASNTQQDVSNAKSEQSLNNLVEIQFKLRIIHGDKTTEINIGKEEDQEEKKEGIEHVPEVYSVKNDEREETTDEGNPKNDISIKIIVKNYKSKSEKRKFEKNKQTADDYYNKISQKFNTVSTGYSDIYAVPTEENENVFSVHRTTINLASSTEKCKTYSAASNERSEIHSAASNERSKTQSVASNEKSKTHSAASNEKSKTYSAASNEKSKTYSAASNEKSKTHSAASNEKSKTYSAASNEKSKTHSAASNEKSKTYSAASNEKSKTYSAASNEKSNTHSVASNEKSKTHSAASNEKSKTHSDVSEERSKIQSVASNDVDESVEPIERELSITKSKTSYTVPSLSTEEIALTTEDEAIDNPKPYLQAYDTHYEYLRETYSNYFYKAHPEKLQKEPETTVAVKNEENVESKSKENSRSAKKDLLKRVFQRAYSKPKSKGRVRQLREMLKIILTDSSTNEELTMTSNELAKDVTFTSLSPNYFNNTNSVNNFYKMESAISSLKNCLLEPNNYPTKMNSDETEDSGQASPAYRGCMCSKVVEKIKDPSLNLSCCCRQKTKQDGEVNCDLYEEFNATTSVDVETQKSAIASLVNSKKSTNIPSTVVTKFKEVTSNKIGRLLSPFINKQDNQFSKHTIDDIAMPNTELYNDKLRKDTDIVVMNSESKRTDRQKKHYSNAADILQCYETKKAVLEIYAEKTYSDHGEHLVAKLPKFLYDKESEIERNYDKIATNSYMSVCTKNIFMMSVGR